MDQPLGIGRATPRRWRHDFVELSFKGGYAGKAVQTSSVKDRNTWSGSEASQRTLIAEPPSAREVVRERGHCAKQGG